MRKIKDIRPLKLENYTLYVINQLILPNKVQWEKLETYQDVAITIKRMIIRGAPLIGIVGAYGFAIGVKQLLEGKKDLSLAREVYDTILNTRPTAVNLQWALERMWNKFNNLLEDKTIDESMLIEELFKEAKRIEIEDYHANRSMGGYGQVLIPDKATVLTHCNTGALATAGWGTALGVIRSAYQEGKDITVLVDETRPYLQGSRLTAWELYEEGIPHYIITDNSAGFLISRRKVDLIIVGADRIVANGDVANKIGTYTLSILAKMHNIPFYVVAPTTTFDLTTKRGEEIPIEVRDEREVKKCGGCDVAPENSRALNYSFDITPAENITAIITEKGLINDINEESIKKFLNYKN